MATLSQILNWWGSSRVPSISQRNETFSSFRHKNDNVSMNEVYGLNNVLNTKANVVDILKLLPITLSDGVNRCTIPADTLVRGFCVIDDVSLIFSVGTNAGLKDYIEDAVISLGNEIIESSRYFKEETEIFFMGVTEKTIIKILKG
jgi:hypothetical protein